MCPVISTPIGAYGLQVANNQNIFLAEECQAFADTCERVIKEPELGSKIAEGAWKLFTEKYTWDIVGQSVQTAVQQCMQQGPAKA